MRGGGSDGPAVRESRGGEADTLKPPGEKPQRLEGPKDRGGPVGAGGGAERAPSPQLCGAAVAHQGGEREAPHTSQSDQARARSAPLPTSSTSGSTAFGAPSPHGSGGGTHVSNGLFTSVNAPPPPAAHTPLPGAALAPLAASPPPAPPLGSPHPARVAHALPPAAHMPPPVAVLALMAASPPPAPPLGSPHPAHVAHALPPAAHTPPPVAALALMAASPPPAPPRGSPHSARVAHALPPAAHTPPPVAALAQMAASPPPAPPMGLPHPARVAHALPPAAHIPPPVAALVQMAASSPPAPPLGSPHPARMAHALPPAAHIPPPVAALALMAASPPLAPPVASPRPHPAHAILEHAASQRRYPRAQVTRRLSKYGLRFWTTHAGGAAGPLLRHGARWDRSQLRGQGPLEATGKRKRCVGLWRVTLGVISFVSRWTASLPVGLDMGPHTGQPTRAASRCAATLRAASGAPPEPARDHAFPGGPIAASCPNNAPAVRGLVLPRGGTHALGPPRAATPRPRAPPVLSRHMAARPITTTPAAGEMRPHCGLGLRQSPRGSRPHPSWQLRSLRTTPPRSCASAALLQRTAAPSIAARRAALVRSSTASPGFAGSQRPAAGSSYPCSGIQFLRCSDRLNARLPEGCAPSM